MTVLLAYDGSEPARKALEYVLEEYADEAITVLQVVPASEDKLPFVNMSEILEKRKNETREALAGVETTAADAGVDVETVIEVGDPPRRIVTYAEEAGVDHIVIGSHGRDGASRIIFGSVAEKVARRAPVNVTIVRG